MTMRMRLAILALTASAAVSAAAEERLRLLRVAGHDPGDGRVDCVYELSGLDPARDYRGEFDFRIREDGRDRRHRLARDLPSADGVYTNAFDCAEIFGKGDFSSGALTVGLQRAVKLTADNYEVVLPSKPSNIEKFAAEELTNFLARVLGAPAVAPADPAVRIYLGRATGFDTSGYELDAFRMQVVPPTADSPAEIRIAGRDATANLRYYIYQCGEYTPHERATLFGVYQFLEDYALVRFYFPGDLGTVANRRESVAVPVQDRMIAPYFTMRRVTAHTGSSTDWFEPIPEGYSYNWGKALSWVRQRLEVKRINFCHGQNNFKIVERFGATHPEYCIMESNGQRCVELTTSVVGRHAKQLCQSSAIWDVFYDDIVASNRTGYVDVMPQDGYRTCYCDACQAAYRRNADDSLGDDYATELVWGKTADLGRRLLENNITDVTLLQMAYNQYKDVPNVELPSNILSQVAVSGQWNAYNPVQHEDELELFRRWEAKLGHRVFAWTYPHKFFSTTLPGVPDFAPRAWGIFFRDASPHLLGAFCESETDHWLFHYLGYYVFSRFGWDPETDYEAVIAEHNRLMFGAGAAAMDGFFSVLEDNWVRQIAGLVRETDEGPKSVVPCEYDIWYRIFSPAVMTNLEEKLDFAAAAAGVGTIESQRVDLIRREIYGPLYRAADAYIDQTDPSRELARRLAFPESGNAMSNVVWRPYQTKAGGAETNIVFSPPDSMRIVTEPTVTTGYYYCNPTLKKSTRYRISYFLRCQDIVSTSKGGGACVVIKSSSSVTDAAGKMDFVFPLNDNFVSGTTGWMAQAFEFETNEHWDESKAAVVRLRIRYAVGTAYFDDVRLDEVPGPGSRPEGGGQ